MVGAASGTNLLARIDEWVASDPIAGRDLEHASAVVRLGVLSSILGTLHTFHSPPALGLDEWIFTYPPHSLLQRNRIEKAEGDAG